METSTNDLASLLEILSAAARNQGMNDTEWAERARLRKETLSRLRHRASCDFETLQSLARVVGAHLAVIADSRLPLTADGHFPLQLDRGYEEELLALCASSSLDPSRWAQLGPRFFMAGLAVMLGSVSAADRRGLLALAESLHPGVTEPTVFGQWLQRSPVRPSRFLGMLEQEVRHAA
ncbi:MAG TPA: hypothetical protein VGM84_24430 [Steroidobacteraceae bacterium]|jgi:DNA-binding phage protein